ncbi:hypothetical protein BG004_001834 [Podila humilis]|nr:hypothetical protein BG004_001834 [Podila humilis]
MPLPTTAPSSLMDSIMGGVPIPPSPMSALTAAPSAPATTTATTTIATTASSIKTTDREVAKDGTVRLFFSLKENPNAVISYAELLRQEQQRQRHTANKHQPTSASVSASLKSTKGTTSLQTSNRASDLSISRPSNTAMDLDPSTGEENFVGGESEAEDEDDDEDDEDDNEDEAEAEDEDDDEDPDDEDEEGSPETKPLSFLDSLAEKYIEENGNEGEDEDDEDEDEDDDSKPRVQKKASRWDTEYYDVEDEFIDDSEAMAESIGMVRPKLDGFFVFRGPVETTTEDADSSDALGGASSRSKRPTKKKPTAGASPLSSNKSIVSKVKSSSLAVADATNDSTSEMSEMEDKPKPAKVAQSGGNTVPTTSSTDATITSTTTGGESGPKKKVVLPKAKVGSKDTGKGTTDTGSKDSDKESKGGSVKKVRPKVKDTLPSSTVTLSVSSTLPTLPTVRVDSPGFDDGVNPNGTEDGITVAPPTTPSRSISPSKSKPKTRPAFETTEVSLNGSAAPSDSSSSVVQPQQKSPAAPTTKPGAPKPSSAEGAPRPKIPRTLEPLIPEVRRAYDIVVELAKKETWEVKTKFPPHIKPPLFECARLALATRTSGYVLDDSFFVHLQAVLPYNKFTLKKLIYRNVLPGWIEDLETQKSKYIAMFTTRARMVWKSSGLVDQVDAEGDTAMEEEGILIGISFILLLKPIMSSLDRDTNFPWTQDLRLLLWEIMEKFMEILAAKSELQSIDDTLPVPPSESKTRKDAYQMLLGAFPTNWMTSYEISRQYSQLKEKVQKQERKEMEATPAASMPPKPVLTRVPAGSLRGNGGPSNDMQSKQPGAMATPTPSAIATTTTARNLVQRNSESNASTSAPVKNEEGQVTHIKPQTVHVPDPASLNSVNRKRKNAESVSGPSGLNQNDPITIDEVPAPLASHGLAEPHLGSMPQRGGRQDVSPHLSTVGSDYTFGTYKPENQPQSLSMYTSSYSSSGSSTMNETMKRKKMGQLPPLAPPGGSNDSAVSLSSTVSTMPKDALRRSPIMSHSNYNGQTMQSSVRHPPSQSPPMAVRTSQPRGGYSSLVYNGSSQPQPHHPHHSQQHTQHLQFTRHSQRLPQHSQQQQSAPQHQQPLEQQQQQYSSGGDQRRRSLEMFSNGKNGDGGDGRGETSDGQTNGHSGHVVHSARERLATGAAASSHGFK